MKIIENPDKEHVEIVKKHLAENMVLHGKAYCPCNINRNEDTVCMCKYFRERDTLGPCPCGRYIKI